MANTGCTQEAQPLARRFLEIFKRFEYVVAPTGSCVSMVRCHYEHYLHGLDGFEHLKTHTFELCEFLHDVLKLERIEGRYPHKVGLHQSCHGLRELRLGSGSERVVEPFNKVARLLGSLEGIALVELQRKDECCGFGGTFAVAEEAVSCFMGQDRIADHLQAGAEIVAGNDMSCLMHLDGLIRRQNKPLQVRHVAEIFAEAARQ
jgi:L-lactate dehydrogenase complex protein LldE